MKTSKLFMAFAKGTESTEAVEVKKYIGVAPMFVIGVNPTKEELEKIYERDIENVPEYLGKSTITINGEEKEVPSVRIDFILSCDEEKTGFTFRTKMSIFLNKAYRFNKDASKCQVIDKYGRTAWVTAEEMKEHKIPVYSNGPANLDKDYRPCYIGEEALTEFLKAFVNIPNVMKYVNNTWIMVDNPEDCEARIDGIDKLFTGDFSELNSIIKFQPNNKVKVLLGVKNSDNGQQYQTVYTRMFLKNNVNNYSRLEKNLTDAQQNGAESNVEYKVTDVQEYSITPTEFKNDNPFEAPAAEDSPWFQQ